MGWCRTVQFFLTSGSSICQTYEKIHQLDWWAAFPAKLRPQLDFQLYYCFYLFLVDPLQGISKAGGQLGMDDARSSLVMEIWRLWDEGVALNMGMPLGPNISSKIPWIQYYRCCCLEFWSLFYPTSPSLAQEIHWLRKRWAPLVGQHATCLWDALWGEVWVSSLFHIPTLFNMSGFHTSGQETEKRSLELRYVALTGLQVGAEVRASVIIPEVVIHKTNNSTLQRRQRSGVSAAFCSSQSLDSIFSRYTWQG